MARKKSNNNGASRGRGSDALSTSMTRMAEEHPSQQFGTKKVRRWLPVLAITYFVMVGATVMAAALLLFDFFETDSEKPSIASTQSPTDSNTAVGIVGKNDNSQQGSDQSVQTDSAITSIDNEPLQNDSQTTGSASSTTDAGSGGSQMPAADGSGGSDGSGQSIAGTDADSTNATDGAGSDSEDTTVAVAEPVVTPVVPAPVAPPPAPEPPKPQTASIEMINKLEPADDKGVFDLMINGRVVLSDNSGKGRSGPISVQAGTDKAPGRIHIVGEAAGRGTDIGYYDSAISCISEDDEVVTSCNGCTSVEVPVNPDSRISCTVTNLMARAPEQEQTEPTAVASTEVPAGAGDTAGTIGTLAPGEDVAPPEISVANLSKPQSIEEPGGEITYTVKLRNYSESNADLTLLESSTAGTLDGKGNCELPQEIPANGGVYTCSYVVDVTGGPGDVITNIISAVGKNDIGADQSTNDSIVEITDVPSSIGVIKRSSVAAVVEPGADVVFTVVVNNTSKVDTVVLEGMEDSVHGDINGKGNCRFPSSVVAGDSFECKFEAYVTGNAGSREIGKLSVTGLDDDGTAVAGSDETLVTINDVRSQIEVVKTPNASSLPEPGGAIDYEVELKNISTVDEVTIDSLEDSTDGDLNGVGDCKLPQTIASGASYKCNYTVEFIGNAGEVRSTKLTAKGLDDDQVTVGSVGEATVALNDVPSSIEVTRVASTQNLSEPGGQVEFDINLKNTSKVDTIRITKLEDSSFGDLDGVGDCETPQLIAPGAAYSCQVSGSVNGVPGDKQDFTTTVSVTDDDDRSLVAESTNTVTIIDVPSRIEFAANSASESVAEPGGKMKYTVSVENKSQFDTVTLTSLQDSILSDLTEADGSNCKLPQEIGVGKSFSCSFETDIRGNAGEAKSRKISVAGVDDDGKPISGQQDVSVALDDVVSNVVVAVTPSVDTIAEPGGEVSFAIDVKNSSEVDSITVTELVDSTFGKLDGLGGCELPQTLAAGDSYQCSIAGSVRGEPGQERSNTIEVTATDDDGVVVSNSAVAKVSFSDVVSSMSVTKQSSTESVPEPGGEVEYTIAVRNTSSVDTLTLNSLEDTVYGEVTKATDTTCKLPQEIKVDGVYTCKIKGRVTGNAGDKFPSALTAAAADDDGVDLSAKGSVSVDIADVPSSIETLSKADSDTVSEPGGLVKFNYEIRNTSKVDSITVNTMEDSFLGDVTKIDDSECSVPQVVAPGSSYSCAVTATVSGNAKEVRPNNFTVAAADDDGAELSSTSTVNIRILDVPSNIEVSTTSANTEIEEPGASVAYTYTVSNRSLVDAVTVTTLTDSVFDSLDGVGDCELPQTLAPGDDYSCSIQKDIAGLPGEQFTNVVTAAGLDDDGESVQNDGSETVTIIDVPSAILVQKDASSESVLEPGGNITFGFAIKNESSADEVVIDNLNDSVYGDVTAVPGSSCELPQTIAAGQSYKCEITAMVRGAAGYVENSVATATGRDDDGNRVAHSDGAVVSIDDVESGIELRVIADKPEVTEPGNVVLYTFEMSNVSAVDPITVTELIDSVYGDLTAVPGTTCLMPLTIAPGGRYGCAIQGQVSGEVGAVLSNEVTVAGRDNDGNELSALATGRVEIVGVATGIRVDQQVDKGEISAPGDDVTFTFNLTNRSPKNTASVSELSDSIFGNLNGLGDCSFPQSIEPNGSFSCSVAIEITGRSGETRTNTVRAVGTDDSGNEIIATDVEKITIR